MSSTLVIATRESRLALWQAEHVRELLRRRFGTAPELLAMTTQGDTILDRTLAKVGGKGLFVKELEAALADGRAQLAVHSLKDVPMDLPPGFALAAVLEREDPRDAFVSNRHAALADLPQGASVGTSSLRRIVQLRALRPDLAIVPLRGNLDTRLRKLDEGLCDAIVLAAAGLKRLGAAARIRALFEPAQMVPCAGPGRAGDRGPRRCRGAARAPRAARASADGDRGGRRARGVACPRRQLQHAAGGACDVARRRAGARCRARPSAADRRAAAARPRTGAGRGRGRCRSARPARGGGVAAAGCLGLPDRRGLSGRRPMRVIVTRPLAQAAAWVADLRSRGIDAVALPLIEIGGPPDAAAVAAAWASLAARRLVVFVSPSAAASFFEGRPAGIPWPAGVRAAAPGPGTSAVLAAHGVEATRIAEPAADAPQFDSEALWARLADEDWNGASVLLVRGPADATGSPPGCASAARRSTRSPPMRARCRRSTRRGSACSPPPSARRRRMRGSSAARRRSTTSWRMSPRDAPGASTWAGARAIATHPRIAERARRAGFSEVIEARPSLASVVACIQSMQP